MKQRVAEMEREAEKLRELQAAAESASTPDGADGAAPPEDEKPAIDGRSVFVGNVRLILHSFTIPLQGYEDGVAHIFPRFPRAGRLQRYSGRTSRTFPGLWNNQQDYHPL